MRRFLAWAVAAALFVATVACAAIGIWTHGPDAARWGGTAFLGLVLTALAFAVVLVMEEL